MNLKEQIAQMRREIEQWQKDPSGSAAMKRQLQALQTELDNLVKRTQPADRRRPRLAVVKPTPPPQVALTPDERAVWSSFLNFHKALLQYSGWVNRDQWLQMADVAADMTGGDPMLASEFPTQPGIWVWDGTSHLWVRTHGLPFPTHDKVWGWDGDEQRWVKIEGGDGEMGVTDGSNAAPGRVGELIAVSTPDTQPLPVTMAPIAAAEPAPLTTIVSMNLSAGDWDITGAFQAAIATPFVSPAVTVCAGFSLTASALSPSLPGSGIAGNWGAYPDLYLAGGYTEATLATSRLSLSSPSTLYLLAWVTPSPPDVGAVLVAGAYMRARRMR